MSRFLSLFKRHSSSHVAKDRLKILLISDRTECSPEMVEMIKKDIISVLSKYMRIDVESTEIQITQTKSQDRGSRIPSIRANIPILELRSK